MNALLLILVLAIAVFGIVIFIYSLIFLITVPQSLKRIANSLEVIAGKKTWKDVETEEYVEDE